MESPRRGQMRPRRSLILPSRDRERAVFFLTAASGTFCGIGACVVGQTIGFCGLPASSGGTSVEVAFLPSRDRERGCSYSMATTSAPAIISMPPNVLDHVRRSPKNNAAKKMTSTTLNLSIGATREAGPIWMPIFCLRFLG